MKYCKRGLSVLLAIAMLFGCLALQGVAAEQSGAVYASEEPAPYPARLRIVTPPDITTYVVHDEPQKIYSVGLRVMLVYSDASETEISDQVTVPEKYLLDKISSDGKQPIPVTYTPEGGTVLTAYFYVDVEPQTLLGIELLKAPDDTRYFAADNLQQIDLKGLSVKAEFGYVNKEGEPVVLSRKDVSADCYAPRMELKTIGEQEVTVSYGTYSVSFMIQVDDADVAMTYNGKPVEETTLKKVPAFGSYQTNPVELKLTYNRMMDIVDVKWSVSENARMRMDNGKVTMRGLFAGAGLATLVVTDNHGGVHAMQTRVIFYRYDWILRLFFRKYL